MTQRPQMEDHLDLQRRNSKAIITARKKTQSAFRKTPLKALQNPGPGLLMPSLWDGCDCVSKAPRHRTRNIRVRPNAVLYLGLLADTRTDRLLGLIQEHFQFGVCFPGGVGQNRQTLGATDTAQNPHSGVTWHSLGLGKTLDHGSLNGGSKVGVE